MKTVTCKSCMLTTREIEVVNLIVSEYSTSEIATKLFLSKETIKSHRARIMEKMQVRNVAGLVREALYQNIISLKTYSQLN